MIIIKIVLKIIANLNSTSHKPFMQMATVGDVREINSRIIV